MAIISRSGTIQRRDVDTFRVVDLADSDLSHYLEINVDDTNNLIDFLAKIGDFRFKDVDDSDNSDALTFTLDDASGSILLNTSCITDKSIFEIAASGTVSGAAATADIIYVDLDLDGITLNDAATSALTIIGERIDFNGATLTAVTLSKLYGLYVDMPSSATAEWLEFAAAYFTDAVQTCYICDSSMGVQASGINDSKYYRCEDFDEETAAVTLSGGLRGDEWSIAGTNASADDITYVQDQGGVIQLQTDGADNDSICLNWLNTAVNIDSNPIIEFRVQIDTVGASSSGFAVGLAETGGFTTMAFDGADDDFILVGMDTDLGTPANMRIWTEDNNGGEVTVDSGVAASATTWITIRIDCTDTEQPRVWINNAGGQILPTHEIAASTITGTLQAGIYMYPILFCISLDAGSSTTEFLVDYIKIWQDRS